MARVCLSPKPLTRSRCLECGDDAGSDYRYHNWPLSGPRGLGASGALEGELISHFSRCPRARGGPAVQERKGSGGLVYFATALAVAGADVPGDPSGALRRMSRRRCCQSSLKDTGSVVGLPFRNGSSGGHRTYSSRVLVGRCFATAHRYRMHLAAMVLDRKWRVCTHSPLSSPCYPCGAVLGSEARQVDLRCLSADSASYSDYQRSLALSDPLASSRATRMIGLAMKER